MIGVGVLVVIFLIACATTLMVLRHQAGRQEKELNASHRSTDVADSLTWAVG